MKKYIGIIGAGSFGTALAVNFSRVSSKVYLKARNKETEKKLTTDRVNSAYLPGINLPVNIEIKIDCGEILNDCKIIFLAVPSAVSRSVLTEIKEYAIKHDYKLEDYIFVNTAKGLGDKSMELPHIVFAEVMGKTMLDRYAILSGPSFAAEVARHLPTAVCAASFSEVILNDLKILFQNIPNFRVYTLKDVLGVELGGSLKNIIAIAAGISDGLNLGNNARAALLTRGIAELTRFGEALGADKRTFTGLSGLGDLMLTATSDLSRNRTVGYRLGAGESLESALKSVNGVAEGIGTTRAVYTIAKENNIYMPITEVVYSLLYEGLSVKKAIAAILERDIKDEFI